MCYGINDSQMRDKENKKATANDPSIVSTLKCIRKRRDKKKEQNVNSKILITTRNEFAKIKIFFLRALMPKRDFARALNAMIMMIFVALLFIVFFFLL